MNQVQYWEKRTQKLIKKEDRAVAKLSKEYNLANKELDIALAELYSLMISEVGGVSPSNLYKGDRYTSLEQNIIKLSKHLGEVEQEMLYDFLYEVYEDEFKEYNKFMDTNLTLDTDDIDKALDEPWNEKSRDQSIMDNKSSLAQQLIKVIVVGIASGVALNVLKREVKERVSVAISKSERIIRTESEYVYNRCHLDNYKKAGIRYYEYLAEMDDRTSKVCRQLNGKEYLVSSAKVGVNYPPMHCYCRSTVIPVVKR